MRKALVAGSVAVVLVAAAVALRVTVAFDAEAVHDRLALRAVAQAVSAGGYAVDPARLEAFHRGAPPCFPYASPDDVTPEVRAKAVAELRDAGLVQAALDASSALWAWGQEDEQARHGPVSDDEALALLDGSELGLDAWLLLRLRRGALAGVARARLEASDARQRELGAAQLAALAPGQADALRAVWARNRRVLSFPALNVAVADLRAAAEEER